MSQAEDIAEQLAPVQIPLTQQQPFSPKIICQNFTTELVSWWNIAKPYVAQLQGWQQRSAKSIADFKKNHILTIGDLMDRSICMAIAGGLTYKLLSVNNPSLFRRTRNLAASFLVNGWLFVPELFNPFLPKID